MSSDLDPVETGEWLESLDAVLEFEGPERAYFLLDELIEGARRNGAPVPYSANTPYLNTIPPQPGAAYPGDLAIETPIRSHDPVERGGDRAAGEQGVVGAGRAHRELPVRGHAVRRRLQPFLARAPSGCTAGTWFYMQGHSAPGHLRAGVSRRPAHARSSSTTSAQEVGGRGLSSYPHPWLMPDFWQFPTVSMGLGPLMAIYQARFHASTCHDRGPGRHRRPPRLGVPGRRRDGRAGIVWAPSRWPAASGWTT